MSADYPFPPPAHEPRILELAERLQEKGRNPFQSLLAVKRNETDPHRSACIRCSTCDGFPALSMPTSTVSDPRSNSAMLPCELIYAFDDF